MMMIGYSSKFLMSLAVLRAIYSNSLTAIGGSSSRNAIESLDADERRSQAEAFHKFMDKFHKVYTTEDEYEERFLIFKGNLEMHKERSVMEAVSGGDAIHGVNRFADLTDEEFRRKALSSVMPHTHEIMTEHASEVNTTDYNTTLMTFRDWRGVLTTSIKDQGICGCCYAFASVEQVESDAIRSGQLSTAFFLSTQQVVSCAKANGCNGGSIGAAMSYMMQNGVEAAKDYPYVSGSNGVPNSCSYDASKRKVTVSNYFRVTDPNQPVSVIESAMANYVLNVGPLAINVNAGSWGSYSSGVMSSCAPTPINHSVQLVGLNLNPTSGLPYWIVRNQWNTWWGMQGYIYLAYGQNACGLTSTPIYSQIA